MNGFNSKVVCKNLSVTIWEILFNIAILIIHHKWGDLPQQWGGLSQQPIIATTPLRSFTIGKPLWYAPGGVPKWGVNENFTLAWGFKAKVDPLTCLLEFFINWQNWQYWHQRLYYMKKIQWQNVAPGGNRTQAASDSKSNTILSTLTWHVLLRRSLNFCSCTTWCLDSDDLRRINRPWLYKEPKVSVLQANVKSVNMN